MSDALANGRPFRTFNLIDDNNREILNITIDRSITSTRVVRELTREWIHTYNQLRPHDSIGQQTPVGFLRKRMGNDHFPTLMTDHPKPLHSPFNRVAV